MCGSAVLDKDGVSGLSNQCRQIMRGGRPKRVQQAKYNSSYKSNKVINEIIKNFPFTFL